MHASPYFDTCVWEVWQYCAAPLAVLQYEEAGRRYPGTGRTGHCYSSTDTWPYHSVSPCQVWQYGADFLMYPSIIPPKALLERAGAASLKFGK